MLTWICSKKDYKKSFYKKGCKIPLLKDKKSKSRHWDYSVTAYFMCEIIKSLENRQKIMTSTFYQN